MALQNLLGKLNPPAIPATGPALEGEIVLPSDTSRPARVGLWVLGLGFGGFLLWAGFAPLDEGVPTQGMVVIDTKGKDVQHMSGGLVREVFVKEGQFVRKDEPLFRLDDAAVAANFEATRQHYFTLRAMEGRLAAEQAGQAAIAFHPDLQGQSDPLLKQTLNNQQQLFQSRRLALQADLQAIEESIQGQQASIQGSEGMLKARNSQLEFIQEQLKGVRDLVKEGYATRNQQLDLERSAAEAMGSIADLQGNILRARRAIAEMKMRAIQRTQEYRKEVDGTLSDVRREVQADEEKFKAATQELGRTIIRAPAEGQVVGLAVQTVGGVIGPGQKLMSIVPQNERLLLEARVPPHLIDRIRPGLPTDVRFSSFAHSPSLVVRGNVDSISSDLLGDAKTGMPYYLGRVSITPEGMKELGSRQMQAGMPAEVVIKTGERTVLAYLLHPFLKRMAASLKEE
jgi:protease secretion system membrane fusion protein